MLQAIRWDVRSAVRTLVARPVFALAVVLTLGLGLGAATAIFGVVNAVVLRPLPYPDDGRLVLLGERNERRNLTATSWPAIEAWRNWPEIVSLGAWESDALSFGRGEGLERVAGASVSTSFFQTLGVRPAIGRAVEPRDPEFDVERRLVLSDALWRRHFGADERAVGRMVTLEGRTYEVVGVMPPGFSFPAGAEYWQSLPPEMGALLPRAPGLRFLEVVARLSPDITAEQVSARLAAWASAREPAGGADRDEYRTWAQSLREASRGGVTRGVVAVFAGVALLLAVACANVAALFVAAGRARAGEFATRAALGAGRGRLVRQLVLEGLLLGGMGGVLALATTAFTRRFIVALSADQIPRIAGTGLDAPVVAFALLASIGAGVVVSMWPAWALTRPAAAGAGALRPTRGVGGGRGPRRVFASLVAAEFALAVILVSGAGLLFESYRHLRAVEIGIVPERVGIAQVVLPLTAHWRPNDVRRRYFDDLAARLEATPGIERAAFISRLPLEATRGGSQIRSTAEPGRLALSVNQVASEGYFDVVGARVVAGRTFSAADGETAPRVVVLNDVAADVLFGGAAQAVGRSVTYSYFTGDVTATVVGVTRAIRYGDLTSALRPELVLPLSQATVVPMSLVYRAERDPLALVPSIRRAVAAADPTGSVALDAASTLSASLSRAVARPRFFLVLFAVFAGLALVLAACGIYGTTAHWMSERWRELGLRIALGATPGAIVRAQVWRGGGLAASGIATGLVVTWAVGGFLRHLLFGVNPADPAAFAVAAGLLAVAGLVACWIPARRVVGIHPADALRSD